MALDRRSALALLVATAGSKPAEASTCDDASELIRQTLTGYARVWSSGDRAAIVASYHDDFVLHYFGDNALSGTHVGKAAALSILAEFGRRTRRELLGIVDILAGGLGGAIIARERLGTSGDTHEVDRLLVYVVRDGLLAECRVYDEDQALIDRLLGD